MQILPLSNEGGIFIPKFKEVNMLSTLICYTLNAVDKDPKFW